MPLVSVLIVNFNGGDYPAQALASLAAQTFRDYEVIVVDNDSTDGSADTLTGEGLPAFRLMRLDENTGFARGNNLAAKAASGEWIALLNPDARAEPDWLATLVQACHDHPQVAHFASAQYAAELPGTLDGAGDNYLLFGIPWRGGFGRPVSDLPEKGWCFSPCGAGAFLRKDVFDQLGGFDERFFCFCEDVDLGFRMQRMGLDCLFLPDAVIHHVGGALSSKVNEFAMFHGTRNRLWTYFKNMPPVLLWLTLPGHIALTLAILGRGLMTGNAPAAWRGLKAAIKGWGEFQQPSSWDPPPRTVSLMRLASVMAWNPMRMLGRKTHVRPYRG